MSTLRVVGSPEPSRAASARLTPIPELPMRSAATNTAAASAASSSKPRRGARSALGELMRLRPRHLTRAVSVNEFVGKRHPWKPSAAWAHGGRALWQALPTAVALHPPQPASGVHRPEAALVPAATEGHRGAVRFRPHG